MEICEHQGEKKSSFKCTSKQKCGNAGTVEAGVRSMEVQGKPVLQMDQEYTASPGGRGCFKHEAW